MQRKNIEIVRGPNIKPCPVNHPLENTIEAKVLIKVGDNITTDHIMPAGAKILPLRSNVPEISKHVFEQVDQEFYNKEYIRKLVEICKKRDILVCFDEIQGGFGRTGKMFACEHEDVIPDIMILGKGITGGYLPLAATIRKHRL